MFFLSYLPFDGGDGDVPDDNDDDYDDEGWQGTLCACVHSAQMIHWQIHAS